MSKAKFNEWLQKELRRVHHRWQPRKQAYRNARVSRGKYRCEKCGHIFPPKQVDIDHIQPVVDPKTGFVNWDDYINRLFQPVEGYQVLCKECHKEKSRKENENRNIYK